IADLQRLQLLMMMRDVERNPDGANRLTLRIDQDFAAAQDPSDPAIGPDDAKGAVDRKRMRDEIFDLAGRTSVFWMRACVDFGIGRRDCAWVCSKQGIETRR